MNIEFNGYTAIKTEEGFSVVFHDNSRAPLELTLNELQEFGNKYTEELLESGRAPTLSDDEKIIFSIWQATLTPNLSYV